MRLFFRKAYAVNKHFIPQKGPVIFACMHPNSFIDDFVLGTFIRRHIRFIARGDVFKTKIARILLKSMRVSPIYRAMDNPGDVKKNLEAFSLFTRFLKNKDFLILHAEGVCVHEKRVRPLKKGMSRIAFSAEETYDFELGVQIVPVSLNYTNAPRMRQEIMVEFSEPIRVSEFKELYLENSSKAMLALNKRVHAALSDKAVVIKEKEAEALTEWNLRLARNNSKTSVFPIFSTTPDRFKLEKRIADQINHLYENSKDTFEQLNDKAAGYFNKLKQYQLKDKNIAQSNNLFWKGLFLTLLSPVFAIGYLTHFLPVFIGKKVAGKIVKTIEFYASIYFATSWLLFVLGYPVMILITSLIWGYLGVLALIILSVFGFFSVLLRDQYLLLGNRIHFHRVKRKHPELIIQLKQERKELVDLLHISE